MLTYSFENIHGPIYEYLYERIKGDIIAGVLKPGEKLPSKRSFARQHGISTITIQNAYDQLISEGYILTEPRKGYFVAEIRNIHKIPVQGMVSYDIQIPQKPEYLYDLSNNAMNPEHFPFSVWASLSRSILSDRKDELMTVSPSAGVLELREAIANHLKSFRGMLVDPNQIIVGAGTEYLYGLLTKLLGTDAIYAIENPGYKKLQRIYEKLGATCKSTSIDSNGITAEGLERIGAQIAHICPNHHFPTGITMPASRRYELLAWANASADRFIIEDDYDSEFRLVGKPIPTLFSIDACEKVIYLNTFSKSLTPTIRISYMVLPVHLAKRFYEELSFYSCTVSNFEQYILSEFISKGYFEKHINRMRLFYLRQRKNVMELVENSPLRKKCRIHESESGLHFLLELITEQPDAKIKEELNEAGIKLDALSDYFLLPSRAGEHLFIVNYSNINTNKFEEAIRRIAGVL